MARVKPPTSSLLGKCPTKNPPAELKLWWGVIEQAARDLRYGDRVSAEEALSFLADSGTWLLTTYYEYEEQEAQRAVVELVAPRRDAATLGASAALRRARSRKTLSPGIRDTL